MAYTTRFKKASRHLGSRSLAGSPLCPTHAPNPYPILSPTRPTLSATLTPECESLSGRRPAVPSTLQTQTTNLHGQLSQYNTGRASPAAWSPRE